MAVTSKRGGALDFLSLDDAELLRQCEVDTFRSSGPGGQKRNKTSSGVRLRLAETGIMVTACEDRSQHVNKSRAVRRLREAIALEVRTPMDCGNYRPSDVLGSCIGANGHFGIGRRDPRYPVVVAEVLDVLAASSARLSDAALSLRIPTAQLSGFIERDSKLWARVNRMRAEFDLKPLR